MRDPIFNVVNSMMEKNTWYIFRDSGVEVRVAIRDGSMNPSHKLTALEANYFRKNILTPQELKAV